MQAFEKQNNGYKYILTVIDVFSRFAWALPLKTKRGEVKNLFFKIFEKDTPQKIQFDEGNEFYNRSLKFLLETRGVKWFSSYSNKKATMVERFNKTMKTRMWKYFTEKETRVWLDIFPEFVHGYYRSHHSSVGMTPNEAREEDNSAVV
jgi:transposase InsO family protein